MPTKFYPRKATKPLKAIRLFCFECMGMSRISRKPKAPFEDVRKCSDDLCPLFEWRFGSNPYKSQSRVEAGRRLALKTKLEPKSVS